MIKSMISMMAAIFALTGIISADMYASYSFVAGGVKYSSSDIGPAAEYLESGSGTGIFGVDVGHSFQMQLDKEKYDISQTLRTSKEEGTIYSAFQGDGGVVRHLTYLDLAIPYMDVWTGMWVNGNNQNAELIRYLYLGNRGDARLFGSQDIDLTGGLGFASSENNVRLDPGDIARNVCRGCDI